jgi:hypothetical protein
MKELLTEWRKFVNEAAWEPGQGTDSYEELNPHNIPGTMLAVDTIRNAIEDGVEYDQLGYRYSDWSRELGVIRIKAKQLKQNPEKYTKQFEKYGSHAVPWLEGVEDVGQLADDMATFGEWIEKSFQKWVDEGQDRDDGETLITRIQSVGRAPEILRQFAPVLHKF